MEEYRLQLRLIIKYLNDHGQSYIEPYLDSNEVFNVYMLFKTGSEITEPKYFSAAIYYYVALYYLINSNEQQMLHNMEISASYKNLNAIRFLGHYYSQKNNISKMLIYYRKAVLMKDPISIHNLGCYYLDKFFKNELSNANIALRHFKLASKLNYADSMINVANIYLESDNIEKALKYWILAAYTDNTKRKYVMKRLFLNEEHLEKYCERQDIAGKIEAANEIDDETVINIIGKILANKRALKNSVKV